MTSNQHTDPLQRAHSRLRASRVRGRFALIAAAMVVSGIVAGCDGGSSGPDPSPVDLEATWLNPLPQGNNLWAVAYVGNGVYFAVGDCGAVLEYDGSRWIVQRVGEKDLSAVWGASRDDVFAAGEGGVIYHFDGNEWSQQPSPTLSWIRDMDGLSAGSIWAAASEGLLRFDGTEWSLVPDHNGEALERVWVGSDTLVYALGFDRVYRFNGVTWSEAYHDSSPYLSDVWGSASDDVYVPAGSRLLHFDGQEWTETDYGVEGLERIDGTSADNVWIATGDGFLEREGSEFVLRSVGDSFVFGPRGIAVAGEGDAVSVGLFGRICRLSGDSWIEDASGYFMAGVVAVMPVEGVIHCFSRYNDEPFGESHGGALRIDGDAVSESEFAPLPGGRITDAWVPDGSSTIFITTDIPAGIWRRSNGAWVADSTVTPLNAIHGTSESDVWATGWQEIVHYDGSRWEVQARFDNYPQPFFQDIWVSAPDNVFVVGAGALHFNGDEWSEIVEDDFRSQLTAVWGAGEDVAYFVGNGGRIYRHAGGQMQRMESGTSEDLHAIHGNHAGDVFAVGDGGVLKLVDGEWQRIESPRCRLYRVWVEEDGTCYAAGFSGEVLRFEPN